MISSRTHGFTESFRLYHSFHHSENLRDAETRRPRKLLGDEPMTEKSGRESCGVPWLSDAFCAVKPALFKIDFVFFIISPHAAKTVQLRDTENCHISIQVFHFLFTTTPASSIDRYLALKTINTSRLLEVCFDLYSKAFLRKHKKDPEPWLI